MATRKNATAPAPAPEIDPDGSGTFTPQELTKADQVLRRLTGTDKQKGKLASLPVVSSLYNTAAEMQTAIDLLTIGHRRKEEIDRLTKGTPDTLGLEGIREQVIAIAVSQDVPGYRWGDIAVAVSTKSSARLDKNLLAQLMMDEGIDPHVVGRLFEQATKEGEPFYECKFVKV